MNRGPGYALAGFALWATWAVAEQTTRNVGDWVVTAESDPSGRGPRVIAQLVQPPRTVGVRCLNHDLSIALTKPVAAGPGPMRPDATYAVEFRADQNDVINTYAIGLSDTAMHVVAPKRMVAQIAHAKEFTFRVTSNSGTTEVWTFNAGAAKHALADVIKECPVD
jgi:hypothetical protein